MTTSVKIRFSEECCQKFYRSNIKLSKLVKDLRIQNSILILKLQESEQEIAQLKACIDGITQYLE